MNRGANDVVAQGPARRFAVRWMVVLTIVPAVTTGGTEPSGVPAPPGTGDIPALVRSLGDPSYDVRMAANRKLLVAGWPARRELSTAAEGPDAEVALRAKQILAVFDELLFLGAEVSLAFSKPAIAWSESVDLTVTVVNRSPYPARMAFDTERDASEALSADARQVADLLDAAEWLKVVGPDKESVDIRLDEIGQEPAVSQTVSAKAAGGYGGTLPPGETFTVVLTGFNRSWARYPLLDRGEYAVTLDYVPNWTDAALEGARAGRVTSNTATVAVLSSAPPEVARSGPPAEILLVREAGDYVARLLNRYDLAVYVNANFGASPPFATGSWVLEADGGRLDLGAGAASGRTWSDFSARRLLEVEPGKSVEIARIPEGDVKKALLEPAARKSARAWQVYFSYSNVSDRQWQVQRGAALRDDPSAPAVLREPLPRRLLNTRLTSNRLPAPLAE